MLGLRETEALAHRPPAPLEIGRLDAVEPGVELDVLAQREPRVEAHLLPHVADALAHPPRMLAHVDPVERDRARRRREQADQHADRRALARAVRAEEGEDHAALDLEIDGVDGREVAEALAEAAREDDRVRHLALRLAPGGLAAREREQRRFHVDRRGLGDLHGVAGERAQALEHARRAGRAGARRPRRARSARSRARSRRRAARGPRAPPRADPRPRRDRARAARPRAARPASRRRPRGPASR